MTDNQDHFVEFEPHTLLKHEVLEAYLLAFSFKLLSSPTRSRVWFLDGFAGAGCDQVGNQGSPAIACRVAAKVRTKQPGKRLGVVCIEKERRYFDHLVGHLDPFRRQDPENLVTLHGEYASRCDEALAATGGESVLAFLDPFGIKGLSAETYAPLLRATGSEIFMLVADAGLARLDGVIHAGDDRFVEVTARLQSAPTLFPEFDAEDLAQNELKRIRHREHVDRTVAGIRRALVGALGPEHAARLEGLAPDRLSTEFVSRLCEVLRSAGARYITMFRVRDLEGLEKHLLLHATAAPIGVATMKGSISTALNEEALPAELRDRLRQDLTVDVVPIVDAAAIAYAGTAVPWTEKAPGSLRLDLLVSTPLFSFQADEVKAEIKRRGWLTRRDRREVVVFPPAGA